MYTNIIFIDKHTTTLLNYSNCINNDNNSINSISHFNINYISTNTITSLDIDFIEWFVGFTDGDGTFSFSQADGKYFAYTFKISQSIYNKRVLIYIQNKLGCGSITPQDTTGNVQQYRIRDKILLSNVIIPIFETYPLHTTKAFSYDLFKKSLNSNNFEYSCRIKIQFIEFLCENSQI